MPVGQDYLEAENQLDTVVMTGPDGEVGIRGNEEREFVAGLTCMFGWFSCRASISSTECVFDLLLRQCLRPTTVHPIVDYLHHKAVCVVY